MPEHYGQLGLDVLPALTAQMREEIAVDWLLAVEEPAPTRATAIHPKLHPGPVLRYADLSIDELLSQ